MKAAYFFIACLLCAWACKKAVTDICTPEKKEYAWQAGRQIDLRKLYTADSAKAYYTYTLQTGSNTVFNYTLNFRDCPGIADDEGARIIVFEVPGTVNSFLLKDSADFAGAKAFINYACFCYPGGIVPVRSGTIEGRKTGNLWHLTASVNTSSDPAYRVNFEADFKMK